MAMLAIFHKLESSAKNGSNRWLSWNQLKAHIPALGGSIGGGTRQGRYISDFRTDKWRMMDQVKTPTKLYRFNKSNMIMLMSKLNSAQRDEVKRKAASIKGLYTSSLTGKEKVDTVARLTEYESEALMRSI